MRLNEKNVYLIHIHFHAVKMWPPETTQYVRKKIQKRYGQLGSGGARILEQVGPAAGPKVVW